MKRLAVLVSGSGSNLQAIIDATQSGMIRGEICLVLSNRPEVFGLERAKKAGIPTACLDHTGFSNREAFDRALVDLLAPYKPDLVILAGFMRILTPVFVDAFQGRIMNIHPSLLPKYPGLHTHQRAIEAGDDKAGATVHFVTAELDGGPHIIQASVPLLETDTADTLAKRVLEKEHIIYPQAVAWFCEDRLALSPKGVLLDDSLLPASGYLL